MKKVYWVCYIISITLCLVGIFCRNWMNILDKVCVILGVALFLFTFVRHCISKAPRCPNCNTMIYNGHIRNVVRQKDGMVPCYKCGSLVRVNHSNRNESN